MIRKCKWCGKEFDAKGTAAYCAGPHYASCKVCGKEFEVEPREPRKTCSVECKSKLWTAAFTKKKVKCKLCGKEFTPKSSRCFYCDDPHYQPCKVCGKPTLINNKNVTGSSPFCSWECSKEYTRQNCLAEYGVEYHCQRPEVREKTRKSVLEVLPKWKAKFKEQYGVDCPAQLPEIREKIRQTISSKEYQEKFQQQNLEKYGVRYAMQSPELRSKQARNVKYRSKLELRLHNILDEYNIEYEEEYSLGNGETSHAFDVYLPKYKILVDCDGIYYHAYISDPDGGKSREDYDDIRLSLVPKDHYFCLIIESDFERGLRQLQKMIQSIDNNIFDYDTDIFQWCRKVGFPYPAYSEKRMQQDYNTLQNRWTKKYNPFDQSGISLVRHYHPSIYHCHVEGRLSPYEAWQDDTLLKKCIANRLVYQNDVDPSKVLAGFNIAKIAPKVSVFNPVLARYLVENYLNEFDVIFDPFSGFSGRLLGTCSTDRKYIGQDFNATVVEESNKLIRDFQLNAVVEYRDSSKDNGQYDCLFTCPPYNSAEIYFEDMILQDCDDWINLVLHNYTCKKYLFVVNKTIIFKDKIVKELPARSHFRSNSEYVILIES